MTVRIEAGARHLLAYCTGCPSWRELAGDRPEALRKAAVHVELVHGRKAAAADLRERAARAATRRTDKPGG